MKAIKLVLIVLSITQVLSVEKTAKTPEKELPDSVLTSDVEKELDDSHDDHDDTTLGHADDVKAEPHRQELIRDYLNNNEKQYTLAEVRDVVYRFFLEEGFEDIQQIRKTHAAGTSEAGDATVQSTADWLEHYLVEEWKQREHMTANEAAELLSHGKYEKYTDKNADKLMNNLNDYSKNVPTELEELNSDVYGLLADQEEDDDHGDLDDTDIDDFELEDF